MLGEHLSKIVQHSVKHDLPALSRSLQRVIDDAIAKGIAENKNAMIDTLYPILGGMVTKYVTQAFKELLEKIDRKIEHGLSMRSIKRKIKAKLTGVSETELLLKETTQARILALLVVHKPTGLLLSQVQLEENIIDDPHMVATMASAIKDFLSDTIPFKKNKKNDVQLISYNDATLYIENAGSVYLVAFLDDEPGFDLRGKLNRFFHRIVKRFSPFFRTYDGNELHPKLQELTEYLEDFLKRQTHAFEEEHSPKFFFVKQLSYLFVTVMVMYLFYSGWKMYHHYTLEKEMERYGILDPSIHEEGNVLVLEGETPDYAVANSAIEHLKEISNKQIKGRIFLSAEAMKYHSQTLHKLKESITTLTLELQRQQKKTHDILALYDEKLRTIETHMATEKNVVYYLKLPFLIKQSLDKAMANSPYYDKHTGKLNFAKLHLFDAKQTVMRSEAKKAFLEVSKRYFEALRPYRQYLDSIIIEAFSDTSGEDEDNLLLTHKRAQYAKALLLHDPDIKRYFSSLIETRGLGESSPVFINDKEDPDLSRRIEFTYKLDQTKMFTNIFEKNGEMKKD